MKGEELKGKLVFCPKCRAESKLNVKKTYDGFKHIGFEYGCSFCGTLFEEGDIPFADENILRLEKEAEREVCEDCAQYAKNLWIQKCMITNKKVSALDGCEKFEKRKPGSAANKDFF